jgi:hypothetical protein
MKETQKSFSIRAFVSILMAFAFLGLAISGIIMYLAPSCSVAERIGWTVAGLTKDQWSSTHQVTALFILVLAIIHLFVYNWRTFMCYLRDRRSRRMAQRDREQVEGGWWMRIPRELIAALVVAVVMYAGALTFIAPFGWLEEGREVILEHYRAKDPGGGEGRGRRSHERDTQSLQVTPDGGVHYGRRSADKVESVGVVNDKAALIPNSEIAAESVSKAPVLEEQAGEEVHKDGKGTGTGKRDGTGQGHRRGLADRPESDHP